MNREVLEYLAWGFIALIGLHLVVRISTAAYFRSKSDFDRSTNNGTQTRTK